MSGPSLVRRLQNLLQIGRTTTPVNDAGTVQTVQAKFPGQVRDAIPVHYHYGFSAHLPLGTDIVVLNITGDSSNGIVISTGHQPSRPIGMSAGQVQIYTEGGDLILLTSGNGIAITPSGGTLMVNGKAVFTGDITIAGKSFLGHEHGQVQSGTSNTGVPI